MYQLSSTFWIDLARYLSIYPASGLGSDPYTNLTFLASPDPMLARKNIVIRRPSLPLSGNQAVKQKNNLKNDLTVSTFLSRRKTVKQEQTINIREEMITLFILSVYRKSTNITNNIYF